MAELKIFGEHDARTREQMERCMTVGSVVGGVLCADGHLGYAQPVGGVIAYEDHVSISGVGYDIGCGNLAARLDVTRAAIDDRVGTILADIGKAVSFGVGRVNAERVEHELFDDADAWRAADTAELRGMAQNQLGTVGSGNHYVDLLEDEDGLVWIGVHFGSRGLGHKSATKYLKAAGGQDGIDVAPAVVAVASEIGERYLAAMELAGRYAYAGRDGWLSACVPSSAVPSPTACTTITTMPGASATAIAICGSCARARRRRFRGSADSSAARWATMQ